MTKLSSIFTVSQLNSYLRALLDGDEILSHVLVKGEISNFKHHSSGHMYFTLKDRGGCLKAVMFRARADALRFRPNDGMSVIVQGNVSVYERDGQYQLYVNSMQPDGVGTLFLAFEQLKEKLEREGLFETTRKRSIPSFPQGVGIATSPTGAAIQDMISIIRRRYPKCKLLLAPIMVQGVGAPESIVKAIEQLNRQADLDVIIVGRGGGSIEELWAFNDERVARAIAASRLPVISAVGHETDYTIADFVADLRAPTPSAAAEAVVPVLQDVEVALATLQSRMSLALRNRLASSRHMLKVLAVRRALQDPGRLVENRQMALDNLRQRMQYLVDGLAKEHRRQLGQLAGQMQALNPLAVLSRGYSLTLHGENLIRRPDTALIGQDIETVLAEGRIISKVIAVRGHKNAAQEN